jgi:hypothetical protein
LYVWDEAAIAASGSPHARQYSHKLNVVIANAAVNEFAEQPFVRRQVAA